MSVSRGTQMRMIIYEVYGTQWARGFDFNLQGEFVVELNTSLPKVKLPSIISFAVSDRNYQNQLVPQKDTFVVDEDGDYWRVREGQIELDAHIMFSNKTKDLNEVYSPEYGWVSYPKRYFNCFTFHTLYKTYIKRDFSDDVKNRGLLFSICSADEVKQIEDAKKNSNHLQQLQEAENKRYRQESPPPRPAHSQPPAVEVFSDRRPQNQMRPPHSRLDSESREVYEKRMKSWADKITLFLILDLDTTKNRQDKGIAWAYRQRGLGLHTTFVHGNSEMLEVGRWYEGVCKWNRKFVNVYDGFYVEKIYKKLEEEDQPVETRFLTSGKVEIELEVNFNEDLYENQLPSSKNNKFVILKNSKFYAIEVSRALYNKYRGQRCKCRLVNKKANNNREITDWEITGVITQLGDALPEEARFSCSHAPTDHPPLEDHVEDEETDVIPTGDDDGAPPVDDDDDTFCLTKKTQQTPPMFTDAPNKDARHPQPVYPVAGRGSADHRQYDNYQGKAYSERSNYTNNRGDLWTHMGYEVEGDPFIVSHALVVMSGPNDVILYANKPEGGILAVDVKLRQGSFISLKVVKLVRPQKGGLRYLAIDGTIQPIPSPGQIRVFVIGGALFVDTECQMEYTRPIPDGYELYSSDLGRVYSGDTLPYEQGGTVSISDMKNGSGGPSWRVWVQYHNNGRANGHEGYRWEAMKVRGPQQQVDRYENEDLKNIFDDIDIDKQRNHFAQFGIGPGSRQNQNTWDHRNDRYEGSYGRNDGYRKGGQYPREYANSMRNGRDEWRGEGSYRGDDGWNHPGDRNRGEARSPQYERQYMRNDRQYPQDERSYGVRSPGGISSMYSAQVPRTAEYYNDNTVPDNLFAQIWNIPEVKKCLKVADYELFCEAENVMEKIKAKQMKNGQSNNMQNDQYREWQDNRSQYSRPASEMRASISGGMRENLRRAFHGEPNSSNSQRGGYDNSYNQHDHRYD